MNIFEKLKHGDPVDMMSEEYRPAVVELHRADRALFHLNHAEPQSGEWNQAFHELFDVEVPERLGLFTPTQIDFPKWKRLLKEIKAYQASKRGGYLDCVMLDNGRIAISGV